MATKTFSGQLDQAIEGAASGNKLLFVPQENLGEVLMGAASEMVVGDDGTYSITLAYNTYSVYHYSDVTKCKILIADGVEVSASTSVSTIPDLIGVSVPVTDSDVLTNQGYLQEGQDYAASAKNSANASASLYNNFNKKIGQAIEPIETGVPSLDIPFNDSGILKKGVGTEYVSGLPVYGVDFTRSTTSTVINKSGVLETLTADEIGIGADGVWLHRSYTNYLNSTVDSSMNNTTSSNITITTDLSPNGSDYWVELAQNVSSYIDVYSGTAFSDGDIVTVSIFVKDDSDPVEIGGYYNLSALDSGFSGATFDPSLGDFTNTYSTVYGYGVKRYGDYYRIWVSLEYLDANSSQNSCIVRVRLNDSADTATLFGVNVSDASAMLPYVDTSSSTTTITSTSCTAPVSGNLPATGSSCTFVVDTNALESGESNRALFYVSGATVSGNFIGIVMSSASSLIFRAGANGDGDAALGVVSDNSAYIDSGQNRLAFVYDADVETVTAYVNGNPNSIGAVSVSGMTFPSDGDIVFGSTASTWYLNAQIKNFKILPYAASADEVKSWGAPK